MIKVLNEKSDNDKYRNVFESQIFGHEGAIKCLKHSNCIVLGFTAEVQDETITNTSLM
jgi:hypothetical protein